MHKLSGIVIVLFVLLVISCSCSKVVVEPSKTHNNSIPQDEKLILSDSDYLSTKENEIKEVLDTNEYLTEYKCVDLEGEGYTVQHTYNTKDNTIIVDFCVEDNHKVGVLSLNFASVLFLDESKQIMLESIIKSACDATGTDLNPKNFVNRNVSHDMLQ